MKFRKVLASHHKRAFSLADLILFSASNLALTLLVARVFGADALADFGLGLAIGLMVQSVMRAIYVVPTALMSPQVARRRAGGTVGQHLILLYGAVILLAAVCLALQELTPGVISADVTLSAAYCTLLYMQADYDRFSLLRAGRDWAPPLLSAANFLPLVVGLLLHAGFGIGFLGLMLMHVGYGVVRSIVVTALTRRPNFRWGWAFIKRDVRRRGLFATINTTAYAGYNHIPLIILAHFAAPIEVAAFVAMRGLVQPTQMVLRVFDFRDKLTMRGASGGTFDGLRRTILKTAIRNLVLSMVMGLIFVVVGPLVNAVAYGADYAGYDLVLLGHAAIFTAMALMLPVESATLMLHWHNRTLPWMIVAGCVGVALSFVLSGPLGAWGAIIACLAGWLVAVGGGIVVLRRVLFGLSQGSLPASTSQAGEKAR